MYDICISFKAKYLKKEARGHKLHDQIYTSKFFLTNFICQMFFDRVNRDFSTNLSKIPNLHDQKTFNT